MHGSVVNSLDPDPMAIDVWIALRLLFVRDIMLGTCLYAFVLMAKDSSKSRPVRKGSGEKPFPVSSAIGTASKRRSDRPENNMRSFAF